MSIFWMVCEGQELLSILSCLKLLTLEILNISHKSRHCSRVHKCLPCLSAHPSQFRIPIPLYNQNVLLWRLVYAFLELMVDVINLTVIMSRRWYITCMMVTLEETALSRIEISLDGILRQPSPCHHAPEIHSHSHVCPLLH